MSRFCIVVIALLLLALPAAASDFYVFISYWDADEFGSTAGGGAGASFGSGRFTFDARGTWYPDLTRSFDDFAQNPNLQGDFDITAIPLEAGVSFHLGNGSSFDPFFGAGVSYVMLDASDLEADDEVGYYAVVGLRMGAGWGFYGDVTYRVIEGSVSGEIDDVVLDDVEVDLSGVGVNAGIRFRF